MSTKHDKGTCPDEGLMVSYLYDEASPSERRSFEQHRAGCESCTLELAALSGVREPLRMLAREAVLPSPLSVPVAASDTAMRDTGNGMTVISALFGWMSGRGLAFAGVAVVFAIAISSFLAIKTADQVQTVMVASSESSNSEEAALAVVSKPNPVEQIPPSDLAREQEPETQVTSTRSGSRRSSVKRVKSDSRRSSPAESEETLLEIGEVEDEGVRLSDLFAELESR